MSPTLVKHANPRQPRTITGYFVVLPAPVAARYVQMLPNCRLLRRRRCNTYHVYVYNGGTRPYSHY